MKSPPSQTSSERKRRWSDEILSVCQILASFLIVIVALLNLSLSDRDKALWSTLVGAGFGYLVPNPALKRQRVAAEANDKRVDESVYYIATEQQLDGPQPEQHGVAIHNETE